MNGRERILRILNRQPVDRPAFDLGGTDCSSIHVAAVRAVAATSRAARKADPLRLPFAIGRRARRATSSTRSAPRPKPSGSARGKRNAGRRPLASSLVVPKEFGVEDLPDGSSVVRNRPGDDLRAACGQRLLLRSRRPALGHSELGRRT